MDISEEIDRSFGAGPPAEQPGTDALVRRGRRALLRRRLATGAAAAAVVAVVGGTAWAATGSGGGPGSAPAPAGPAAGGGQGASGEDSHVDDPTRTAQARTEQLPRVVVDPRLDPDVPMVEYPQELRVSRDLEITQRVDNPYDVPRPGWSVALDFARNGQRYWYAAVYEHGGSSVTEPVARGATVAPGVTFREWIAEQETIRGDGHGPAAGPGTPGSGTPGSDQWPGLVDLQLVRFDPGSDHLTPFGAVTLLQQRAHPDLPESWAGPEADSAVAEVRSDGVRYYVLARRLPGATPQYIAVKAEDGGATLDDFLDLARERYAEGGGGLL